VDHKPSKRRRKFWPSPKTLTAEAHTTKPSFNI
jgi:hypothetical protein